MSANDFHDSSLIISALEKRELLEKSKIAHSDFFLESTFSSVEFLPYVSVLPIKIGLNLRTIGTKIISATIKKGYFFSDFESRIKFIDTKEDLENFKHLNYTIPIFYQMSYILALENIASITPNKESILARGFAVEIARIFHNLLVLKNIFICIKENNLLSITNKALSVGEKIFSFYRSVSFEIGKKLSRSDAEATAEELKELLLELEEEAQTSKKLFDALSKKAIITNKIATEMGLTGLFLKANRINKYSYADTDKIYLNEDLPEKSFKDESDAYARCLLRIEEAKNSIIWFLSKVSQLRKTCDSLAGVDFNYNVNHLDFKNNFSFGELESPEGKIIVSIFKNENDGNFVLNLTNSAYFIAQAIPLLINRLDLKDLALILNSLGINAYEIDR